MQMIKRFADNREANTLATRLRQKRFLLFTQLLESVPRPIKILDVGGTLLFWERMGFTQASGIQVVMLNVTKNATEHDHFISVVGDARDMSAFADNEFDVVFSNSVIEHVGTYADQRRMAEEVKRVGKRYFLQTPNRYFPISFCRYRCGYFLYVISMSVGIRRSPTRMTRPGKSRRFGCSHNGNWWLSFPERRYIKNCF
jgi:hypothetical protein